MCARGQIERSARLVDEPPAHGTVNQSFVHLFVNVVDQPVYLCVVGKTYVNYFAVYSKRAFLRFSAHRENHIEMLQNLVKADVDICVDPADSDRAVQPRHPTRCRNGKLPRLALRNRWRRCFLRREFHRTCPDTPDDCEHRACQDKQSYSHGPTLLFETPKSEKNKLIISPS